MRLIFLILLLSSKLLSQDIQIFNIDNSSYPIMKGNIILLNQSGNIIYDTNIENIKLFEKGKQIDIIDFSCDINTEKEKLSAILSMDLSLSMKGEAFELAKQGAKSFIEIFDEANEEVAINGFSDFALLLNDFSTNKSLLSNAIDNMFLIGGTNFNDAFLNNKYGSIQIAKRAKNKPVVIILTDGFANGRTDEVIRQAKELDLIVYSIVLYNSVPKFLKEVSDGTGGLVFDKIENVEEIIKAYETIYRVSQNINACTISWKSENCDIKRVLDYEYSGVKKSSSYIVENSLLTSFEYPNSEFISFKGVELGNSGRRVLTLSAKMDTITINDIIKNNNKFDIIIPNNETYPIVIPRDSTFNFFVDFNYDEEGFQFGKFTILSDVCQNNIFYASGGIPFGNQSKYIDIIEPNGGEKYFKGADTLIKWQANEEDDKLILEFSSDNGKNWKEIANNYIGYQLKHEYPTITSNECLVRITKLSDSLGYEYMVTNTDSVNNNCVSWQGSGNSIIVGGTDGYIRFVDGFAHYNKNKIKAHDVVTDIEWAPDAIRYASSGNDGKIKLWIDNDDIAYDSVRASDNIVSCIEWSPDGNRLVSGDKFGNLRLWNPSDLSLIKELKISQRQINDIRYSPDGNKIAVALSDSSICILFSNSFQQLLKYPMHKGAITSLDWINNDWLISVSSQAFNNQVLISSSVIGQQVGAYSIGETLSKVRVSRENNLAAFVGASGKIHVWGTDNYQEKFNIQSATSWSSVDLAWSPDETRIVVASNGKNSGQTLKFNSIKQFPQYRTTSDSTFSLIDYKVFIDNIDFGRLLVNRVRDSTITNYIKLDSDLGLRIDSIRIVNDPNRVFNLVPKGSEVLNRSDNYEIQISFAPKLPIKYNSRIEIFTEEQKYTKSLTGEGYENGISDYELDFGNIEINNSDRKLLEISNSSVDEIEIDSIVVIGPNIDNFSLIQGNTPSILKPNNQNTKNLVFEFTPNYGFNYTSLAYIYFKDKDAPARIFLNGRGVKSELSFTSDDFISTECNLDRKFEIKIKNTGLLDLEVNDLNGDNITFNKNNFTLKNNEETIISGIIDSQESGTFIFDYSFSSNDIENQIITDSIVYINNYSKIQLDNNNLDFVSSNVGSIVEKTLEIKNIDKLEIEWNYNLPYQINNSNFYIKSIDPIRISENESSTFIIEYLRNNEDDESTILSIFDNCENEYSVLLDAKFTNTIVILEHPDKLDLNLYCIDQIDTSITIKNNSGRSIVIDDINSKYIDKSLLNLPIILEDKKEYELELKLENISESSSETIDLFYEDEFSSITVNINLFNSKLNLLEQTKQIIIDNSGNTNSYFLVKNEGTIIEDWKLISSINPNIQIVDISPNPTLPNETATITFFYNKLERNNIEFEIIDSCGNSYIQELNFEFGDIPILDLSVSNIEGNIEDYKSINISLLDFQNVDLTEKEGIRFDLVYNSTLLKRNVNYNYDNYLAIENVELKFDELIDNNWVLDDFQILWGNDSTSEISIKNIEFILNDENKISNVTPGILRVLDLCIAGGTRLYYSSNIPFVLGVYPNPLEEISNLELVLYSDSQVEINIYNYLGEKIENKVIHLNQGKQEISLTDNYKSGKYLIITKIYDLEMNKNYIYQNTLNVVK